MQFDYEATRDFDTISDIRLMHVQLCISNQQIIKLRPSDWNRSHQIGSEFRLMCPIYRVTTSFVVFFGNFYKFVIRNIRHKPSKLFWNFLKKMYSSNFIKIIIESNFSRLVVEQIFLKDHDEIMFSHSGHTLKRFIQKQEWLCKLMSM